MPRRRITTAVLAVVTALSLATAGTALYTAREAQMDVQDAFTTRQPVMANATATSPTGATVSVNGNDAVGQVNIQTGAKTVAGSLIHVTFKTPYQTQPFVYAIPEDQPPPADWYVTVDTNGFDILVGTAPKPDTNYPFNYLVVARPWLMYLSGSGQPTGS